MSPQTIPIDQNANLDWQQYPPHDRKSPPQQADLAISNLTEEISYVSVDSESSRPSDDEELPRKLPRKVNLAGPTETLPLSVSKNEQTTWEFPPPDLEKKATILERPPQPRFSATKVFEKKSVGDPRLFQHIHTLRSHLSPVRALIACNAASTLPDETCFISAGDDSTIKFWRVSRVGNTAKKKGNFDILPQITFRGHTGMITCLAESLGNIWSAGSDGGIRGWKVPSATRDAYGSSGTNIPSRNKYVYCF
jgi:WD40 repeat protein